MKEFIERSVNRPDVIKAARQQRQLSYFTLSDIQDDSVNSEYLEDYVERNIETNDHFKNFVKSVFKPEIALLFFKYLRLPTPSATLVQNRILPDLKRVFYAEDSFFSYVVNNVNSALFEDKLKDNDFTKELFNRILFYHNSILLTHIDPITPNTPVHHFIDIGIVRSIEVSDNKITKIAYNKSMEVNGEIVHGYVYVDDLGYKLYNNQFIEIDSKDHDFGYCPASFIVPESIDKSGIVRKSIFSYIRSELEEFTFMKTIQKMIDPNGAIPIRVQLDFKTKKNNDVKAPDGGTGGVDAVASQESSITKETSNSDGIMQPGNVVKVPISAAKIPGENKIDTDLVKNMIHWVYTPTDALVYWNNRVNELRNSILGFINGDIVTANESAKNTTQIEKSISVLENTLRSLSQTMSKIKTIADTNSLIVMYGKERVLNVNVDFGSDFYLDDESLLLENFEKSPNPIERKNLLVRLNQNKYKTNSKMMSRLRLLYDIIPFESDKSFQMSGKQFPDRDAILYTQFDFWINRFEGEYGNIVEFFNGISGEDSTKYIIIRNLIYQLILQENGQQN